MLGLPGVIRGGVLSGGVSAAASQGLVETVFGPGPGKSQPFGLVTGPDEALYVCEVGTHVIRRVDLKTGASVVVAGSGRKGYGGDGGPATEAELNEPYEVRFDGTGNMWFVEMQNHVVRCVEAGSGVIRTVAGTGRPGFSGDGGPAVSAELRQPHSIALDRSGSLYICDIGNHRIRRVEAGTGVISTFAGTGGRGATPDGATLEGTPLNGPRALDFDGRDSLYLALREGNALYRIDLTQRTLEHLAGTGKSGYGGDGGPARSAILAGPKGVAVSACGDVWFADTESHTIRVYRSQRKVIETVVGNGERGDGPDGAALKCRLDRPHGVFVSKEGRLFIGDSNNHRVRSLQLAAGEW
ncbi:MAG: Serine/threonine-protein kinase PknD [Planctomycetota bacterium]|jgi:streptogramin lyase